MKRLTKIEVDELSRLWDELSRVFHGVGPPVTRDEMIEADVDALLAGVISSDGRLSREGLAEFEAVLSDGARSPALQEILDRLAVVLGLGHEPQGRARS